MRLVARLGLGGGRGVAQELLDRRGDGGRLLGRRRLAHLDPRPCGALLSVAAHGRGSVTADGRRSSCSRRRPCFARSSPRRRSSACVTGSWSTPATSGRCRRRCTSTPRRTATSARCRPRARASRSSSGSPRSRGNPEAGLPVVMGVICVSSVADGRAARARGRALRHRAAHRRGGRRGRAGAGPRGRAQRRDRSAAGSTATWAARCLAAAEYGARRLLRPRPRGGRAARGRARLGGRHAARTRSACDVVTCVTPGNEPVVLRRATCGPGFTSTCSAPTGRARPRPSSRRSRAAELFCDEWTQASHGGELTGAVEAGLVSREQVTELGAVLTGSRRGVPHLMGLPCSTPQAWRSRTSRSASR